MIILAIGAILLLVVLGVQAIKAHVELTENQRAYDAKDPGKILAGAIGGFFNGFGL